MKIAYLTNNVNPKEGWGRYAYDLISGIRKSGHEVVILKEVDDGYEGTAMIKRGWGMFGSALKIRKLAADCDIIHALDVYPYGIIAWLANIFLKKKLVITALGTYSIAPLYNLKTRWLSKKAIKSARAVVAISKHTKSEIVKVIKADNLHIVNPGIDFQLFYQEHIMPRDKFILSVGALKERKGYHISISAFAEANISGLNYIIVGNQNNKAYFSELVGIAKKYGVENRVVFLQNISDVELKKLYRGAQLFILTSINLNHHFEGFGLVFLEAAASGLPVIGTSGNGIEDAIGKNGRLVPQNDVIATAKAMHEIIEDREKWQEMSLQSYEWARTHDLSGMIGKYLDLYHNN